MRFLTNHFPYRRVVLLSCVVLTGQPGCFATDRAGRPWSNPTLFPRAKISAGFEIM